jgi:acyl-coenzyme A synthetase/AMP-(fatty) acid ligase
MVGRYKDLIKVHGFQVAPAELEELLMSHPEIKEAAVIGIPDEQYLELPKAFVTLHDQKAKDKLKDILQQVTRDVQYWKTLRGGLELLQAMPTFSIGKLDRAALRSHVPVPENVIFDDSEILDD